MADINLEDWTGYWLFLRRCWGIKVHFNYVTQSVRMQLVMNFYFYNGFGSTGIKGSLSFSLRDSLSLFLSPPLSLS